METFYLISALVGGTILVLQFGMTLLGLAGDGGDLDTGDADLGGGDGLDAGDGHHTVWIFKVLSYQTLVAAFAFFGIGGKAAAGFDFAPAPTFLIALGAGFVAMYAVYYLLRLVHRFNSDGTVRINDAVGHTGAVYVPIPGDNAGAGKIHLILQNRTVELEAMTAQDRLPTGAMVRIVGILGPDKVEVERLIESETPTHA